MISWRVATAMALKINNESEKMNENLVSKMGKTNRPERKSSFIESNEMKTVKHVSNAAA
jgi:hypothetical protein